jgi:hypothetical protein
LGIRDKRGRDKGAAGGPDTKHGDDKFIYHAKMREQERGVNKPNSETELSEQPRDQQMHNCRYYNSV